MFTGIVTHVGELIRVEDREGGARRFVLRATPGLGDAVLGASIAVDGVCLTVAAREDDGLAFDVVPETLRRSSLGDREPGDLVNLEPSLHLGDEMGGHLVSGHVEGLATLRAIEQKGEDVRLVLGVGGDLEGAMIPKGSIALDGVSLTVGEVWRDEGGDEQRFSVYLVPHTLAVTGLARRNPGDRVNVEPDMIGRWVEHHLRRIGISEPATERGQA